MGIESIVSANQLPTAASAAGQNVLGKDDFLKLLMLQLKQQDPLNPMDNQAMISQMAQFSSLEQMSNLNANFAKSNMTSALMDATRLLGKEVVVNDPSSADGTGTITSKVDSVSFSTQGPVLKLKNGMVTNIQDVLTINEAAAG